MLKPRYLAGWFFAALLTLCMAVTVSAQSKGIDPALLAKAEAGDAKTQYMLGKMYYNGHGVRRDYAQAAVWFRKASEQGDPDSQYMLGGLYHYGRGVPQDDTQAVAWFKKAAEQGYVDAESFLSTCYSAGWGVAQDDVQSVVWLRKAAEQGDATSQYMLGWAYEAHDVGIPKDYAEAYFWLDVAASGEVTRKNRKEALKRRNEAASHLTPADLSRVQERVRKWFEDHPVKP
jgi:TPR repeat protein